MFFIPNGAERKVAADLRTAFMGSGMRGFREILKQGDVLSRIEDEEGVCIHNDRCAMIEAMVGQKNMDKLIDILCDGIMELCQDA